MKRIYMVINGLFSCDCEINFHSFIKKDIGRVLLAFFIGGVMLSASAQVNAQSVASKETAVSLPTATGTFQLIFNSRTQDKEIKLSVYELRLIEKLRKENEVVYARASYSDDLRIKILPRNVISRADFKPLPIKYYKEEHNYEEWGQIRYVEFE